MGSDKKISEILEKQLKAIGQKIRLDLLKNLHLSNTPLSFSDLQKSVIVSDSNSVNLSFHLKSLKKAKLIRTDNEGYSITDIGKQILEKVIDIEQILNRENKNLVIRTSKYSTEPFNIKNVKEYLIREADMNALIADQIAKLVEKRLSETNIEYLTAPLMREYINAVLLEEGLEEYRHKLTRLGIPPYDAKRLYKKSSITPNDFITRIGSEGSEQFLLLNLLPNELADLYLSNKIILLNLNTWALRPLSIFLNLNHFFDNTTLLSRDPCLDCGISCDKAINIYHCLQEVIPFFSNNILFYNIASISEKFNTDSSIETFLNRFLSLIIQFNQLNGSRISFSFNPSKESESLRKLLYFFIEKLLIYKKMGKTLRLPQLFSHAAFINNKKHKNHELLKQNGIIILNKAQRLIDPDLVRSGETITKSHGEIILDKILIDLYSIAQNSHRDDTSFFNLLRERMNSVFSLFHQKELLMNKKLANSKTWINFLINFLNYERNEWISESIKSISFVGLNEAVKYHCGIELDRIETSREFGFRILRFMKKMIEEKNLAENEKFCLSQPHYNPYLEIKNNQVKHSKIKLDTREVQSQLIRKGTSLTLEEKISIYEKFDEFLDGGSLFTVKTDLHNTLDYWKLFNKISNSKLSAFKII